MTLLDTALRLAFSAHNGQMRKGEELPYIAHPVAVALTLARHGFSDTVLAAALTHDLVEDTKVTDAALREALGDEVADLVAHVTEDKSLPWQERKERYMQGVGKAPVEAKAISAADKVDNLRGMLDLYTRIGTDTWKLFTSTYEKRLWFEETMLTALKSTWSHPLVDEYERLVEQMRALS